MQNCSELSGSKGIHQISLHNIIKRTAYENGYNDHQKEIA